MRGTSGAAGRAGSAARAIAVSQPGGIYSRGRWLSGRGLHSTDGQGPRASLRLRASARAAAAANRLDRPGCGRGTCCITRPPVDQARGEGVRPRPCRPRDGPHHSRGPGHAGKDRRTDVEGDPTRSLGRQRSVRRSSVRLPEPGPRCGRASARIERQGGVGRDGVSLGPDPDGREGGRGSRGRRDGCRRGRHGDRPRRVPLRALRQGVRRDRPGQGGLRRRPLEGDPRGRRARDLRQRPPRFAARDGRGRRLHQDLDGEAATGRDPAGHARHARGDPRRPRGDRDGRSA